MKLIIFIRSNLFLLALLPGMLCLSSFSTGYALKTKEEEQNKQIENYEIITERLVSTIQVSDSLYELLLSSCSAKPCDSSSFHKSISEAKPCKQLPCLPVPCIPDTVIKTDTVEKVKNHFLFAK